MTTFGNESVVNFFNYTTCTTSNQVKKPAIWVFDINGILCDTHYLPVLASNLVSQPGGNAPNSDEAMTTLSKKSTMNTWAWRRRVYNSSRFAQGCKHSLETGTGDGDKDAGSLRFKGCHWQPTKPLCRNALCFLFWWWHHCVPAQPAYYIT